MDKRIEKIVNKWYDRYYCSENDLFNLSNPGGPVRREEVKTEFGTWYMFFLDDKQIAKIYKDDQWSLGGFDVQPYGVQLFF